MTFGGDECIMSMWWRLHSPGARVTETTEAAPCSSCGAEMVCPRVRMLRASHVSWCGT